MDVLIRIRPAVNTTPVDRQQGQGRAEGCGGEKHPQELGSGFHSTGFLVWVNRAVDRGSPVVLVDIGA